MSAEHPAAEHPAGGHPAGGHPPVESAVAVRPSAEGAQMPPGDPSDVHGSEPGRKGASGLRLSGPRSTGRRRWAQIIIWTYSIAAASAVLMLFFRAIGRTRGLTLIEFVFSVLNVPLFASLVSVAMLVLITGALIRRKRLAIILVALFEIGGALQSIFVLVVLIALARLGALPDGLTSGRLWLAFVANALAPIVGVAALVIVWRSRAYFPGRMARGSILTALGVLISGTVVTVVITHLLLVWKLGHGLSDRKVLLAAMGRALGVGGAHRLADVPDWITGLASLLIGLTILGAAVILFRSRAGKPTWAPQREIALRRLLAEYGSEDSLSYFATRRDKDLMFTPDGSCAIAYEVAGAVCMASGDPIGPRSTWPRAIAQFREMCDVNGWVPSVISAGEDAARAWTNSGMLVIQMGDEAILDADRFDLATTSMTPVRRAVHHARAAGLTASVRRHASLTDEERQKMVRLADEWRMGGEERGFSMALGRLGDPADGSCTLVVAEDADGEWKGLLSFVPWGRHGASLDVMRRSPDAPQGVTELMVSTIMTDGRAVGVRQVSLNFAMFRQVFVAAEKVGAGPLTKIAGAILTKVDKRFQLERLYRSNLKYHPEWKPRYLLVDTTLSLVRATLAAGALEGFLPALDDKRRRQESAARMDPQELAEVRQIDERKVDVSDLGPRRSDQSKHRLRHMEMLRAAGMEPYPIGLTPPRAFAEVVATIDRVAAEGAVPSGGTAVPLLVAGRVRHIRDFGGVVFVDLVDGTEKLQAVISRSAMRREQVNLFRAAVDVGDIVEIEGRAGTSRNGTPSLIATAWAMASKSLQPIPFDSFEDPEARLRRRSTDLIVHPRALGLLKARSIVIRAVRDEFLEHGFTEVETPMLQTVHGGANARPFRTFINAYSTNLYLRIAPELPLKRLLVGGMGPIFEIGRNFRNEGADATHNPEFTVVEAYEPFSDYHGMRRLTEAMIKSAAQRLYGAEVIPLRNVRTGADLQGRPLSDQPQAPGARLQALLTDVSEPWAVVSVCDALSKAVGREISLDTDIDVLLELAKEHEVAVDDQMGPGAIIEELYGELVESKTIRPTFYVDFPAETSPLTGPHRTKKGLVERWDLVICGMEIGTAYSELADPVEQRRRFTEQSLKAAAGDAEAMEVDEDFLASLENGMPPAGGLGIGLDRLVMLLTDTSIREVLAFPFVRPEKRD